ncbi:hypothetical protein DFJ74DRAFT_693048 [Hyaloraphidium curvatum]|nr:hypothetical protein DFJ74DRAFT_693048 [Hyaloraphidium curvatum]
MDLAGKVCIVTGGSEGIGRAIVERLLEKKAKVLIGSRGVEKAEKAIAEIKKSHGATDADLAFHRTDVTKPEDNEALVQAAVDKFGGCDVVFANAGIVVHKSFLGDAADGTDVWFDGITSNLVGSMYLARIAVGHWLKTGKPGCLVVSSSGAGYFPGAGHPDLSYAVSKAGQSQLTVALQGELDRKGKTNVRCNCIMPGFVKTDIFVKGGVDHTLASLEDVPNDPNWSGAAFAGAGGWTPMDKLIDAYMTCVETDIRGQCFIVCGAGGEAKPYPGAKAISPGGDIFFGNYISKAS